MSSPIKKIKFSTATDPIEIASTQVVLENTKTDKEANALTLDSSNTGIDDKGNPTYTLGLSIDGKTVVKGDDGLKTDVSLSFTEPTLIEGEKYNTIAQAEINLIDNKTNILSKITPTYVNKTISVCMSVLYDMKSNGKLIEGQTYRITDYVTKTNESYTDIRAANIGFDVIVTATGPYTLSEKAKASEPNNAHVASDFYKSNFGAWELGFRVGFDKEEFPWAYYEDKYSCVIYYMKDEHGNEAPYDFKNIQFKRYKITADDKQTIQSNKSMDGVYHSVTSSQTYESTMVGYSTSSDDFNWFYTFSALRVTWDSTNHKFTAPTAFTADSAIFDASIVNVKNLYNTDENANNGCSNNVIKPYYTNGTKVKVVHTLNNNIMLGWYGDYSTMESDYQTGTSDPGLTYNLPHDNYFASNCRNNTLSIGSWGNKLGEGCYLNMLTGSFLELGQYCFKNKFEGTNSTLGSNCYDNMCIILYSNIGNYFYSNYLNSVCDSTIADYFNNNKILSTCNASIFGNYCSYITANVLFFSLFGNYVGNKDKPITLKGDCKANVFGNYTKNIVISGGSSKNIFSTNVSNITLGAYCQSNYFGTDCSNIVLGNNCTHNTFANNCSNISFQNSNTQSIIGYLQNCVFECNNSFTVFCNETLSSSNVAKNIYFTCGLSSKSVTLDSTDLNSDVKITYSSANNINKTV